MAARSMPLINPRDRWAVAAALLFLPLVLATMILAPGGATAVTLTEIFAQTGPGDGDELGLFVGAAGDINADGWPDFTVGAPRADGGASSSGLVWIYFGGPGLDAEADLVLEGEASFDQFGLAVRCPGDVNDDGYDDLVVGAPYNDAAGNNAGRVYVYFGGPSLDTVADLTLDGEAGDGFGWSLAGPGDLDGGGPDIVVGAPSAQLYAGRAYVFNGGAALDDTVDVVIEGKDGTRFGWFMNRAGDFDADGWPDLLIGANTDRWAYLFRGGADFDATWDYDFVSEGWGDRIGYGLGPAGDFNGDGYDDIVIGAMHNDAAGDDAGRAYLYYGGPATDNIADLTFTGEADKELLGRTVDGSGDLNHDGYTDIVVGAPTPDTAGYGPGRTRVYFGGDPLGPNPPDNVADLVMVGEAESDRHGAQVAIVGDVDGDGRADFLSGANLFDADTLNNAGKFYLYSVPNELPLALADTAATADTSSVIVDVLANDADTDGLLVVASVAIEAAPLKGTAEVDTLTGAIVFTPLAGTAGADSLTYTVTDDEGGVSAPATVLMDILDTTPPVAVASVIATGGAGFVSLAWDGAPADADSVEIWRCLWRDGEDASAYPLYDDAVGSLPPVRAGDRDAVLLDISWMPVATLPVEATAWVDSLPARGVYEYEIFTRDASGNWGPHAETAPLVTSYLLGDVADSGDGQVDASDAAALVTAYGTVATDSLFVAELDIGPTDDGLPTGIPVTDGVVDFEDLMILAMAGIDTVAAQASTDPVDLSWRRRSPEVWVLELDASHGSIKGLRLALDLPPGVTADVARGAAAEGQSVATLLATAETDSLDVALLLPGAGLALDGTGELLRVTFSEPVDAGMPTVAVRSVDNTPLDASFAEVSDVPTADLPTFALAQNSPNPFNPRTTIRFTVPTAGRARLTIYDIRGRRVVTLVDESLPAGPQSVVWEGRDARGAPVGSGVYLYRLETGGRETNRRMTLVK